MSKNGKTRLTKKRNNILDLKSETEERFATVVKAELLLLLLLHLLEVGLQVGYHSTQVFCIQITTRNNIDHKL